MSGLKLPALVISIKNSRLVSNGLEYFFQLGLVCNNIFVFRDVFRIKASTIKQNALRVFFRLVLMTKRTLYKRWIEQVDVMVVEIGAEGFDFDSLLAG